MPSTIAASKAAWHRAQAADLFEEYVSPELQKQDLPLIAKQRPLRSWERP